MCGITGISNIKNELIDISILKNMTNSLRYWGPNDEGYLFADVQNGKFETRTGNGTVSEHTTKDIDELLDFMCDLTLGHRRLFIFDLSVREHQPMDNGDGSVWIIHNGEIFNFAEIRNELKTADTEVVIKSYQGWVIECVDRFNGQYAFCIYDRENKRIFCSRDRYGSCLC